MGKGKRKYEPEKRELTNLISLVRRFRKSPLQSQEVFDRLLEYQKNIQKSDGIHHHRSELQHQYKHSESNSELHDWTIFGDCKTIQGYGDNSRKQSVL